MHVDTNSDKMGSIIGDHAKIGVNATLYPGVKVGTKSIVAPGEIVRDDIPENTFFCKGIHKENKL
jgi:bifunctional UDP-N-acetylglucosamine pyrophosphorylase/glucosamine-1-phosphate N-acetyltransferase